MPARVTPGSCCTRSTSVAANAARSGARRIVSDSITRTATAWPVSMPMSTVSRRRRLRVEQARRQQQHGRQGDLGHDESARQPAPAGEPAYARRSPEGDSPGSAACTTPDRGRTPWRRLPSLQARAAGPASRWRPRRGGADRRTVRREWRHGPSRQRGRRPRRPPRTSRTPSTKRAPRIGARDAPSASLTARSCSRAALRPISSVETLAQATSSTTHDAARKAASAGRASP